MPGPAGGVSCRQPFAKLPLPAITIAEETHLMHVLILILQWCHMWCAVTNFAEHRNVDPPRPTNLFVHVDDSAFWFNSQDFWIVERGYGSVWACGRAEWAAGHDDQEASPCNPVGQPQCGRPNIRLQQHNSVVCLPVAGGRSSGACCH